MKKLCVTVMLACSTLFMQAQDQRLYNMVVNGVQTSVRQTENHEWKEAFATCRGLDEAIRDYEKSSGQKAPQLYYLVAKERLRMYQRMSKAAQCSQYLAQMEALANQAGTQELKDDYLMAKASFYQSIGKHEASSQCYKSLVRSHLKGKDDQGVENVYKEMTAKAKTDKNAAFARTVDQMYKAWQDSIAAIAADKNLKSLQNQYATAQQTIEEKDSKITWQGVWIVVLGIVAVALAGGLIFVVLYLLKSMLQIKKLKSSLAIANENNERKSEFIDNLGAQMNPSLEAIESGNVKTHVTALKDFINHTCHYMQLEGGREELYEMAEYDISALCSEIVNKAKESYGITIPVKVEVPRISFVTNAEALEEALMILIGNLVKRSETQQLNIEFKKGGAKSGKIIVTGMGVALPEEEVEDLFKPFAKIQNLAEGDGLDLPTCSMIAYKLNGSLCVAEEYHKGLRFILELRTKK